MARVAFVALLAGAVGIAFAPIFVRLSELGPSATAFYRLAFAPRRPGGGAGRPPGRRQPGDRDEAPHRRRPGRGGGRQSLIVHALAHLPSAFSSVSLLLQPVAAAMLAWVILGEALGTWQGLGGAIVLVGIVLARRGSAKPA